MTDRAGFAAADGRAGGAGEASKLIATLSVMKRVRKAKPARSGQYRRSAVKGSDGRGVYRMTSGAAAWSAQEYSPSGSTPSTTTATAESPSDTVSIRSDTMGAESAPASCM